MWCQKKKIQVPGHCTGFLSQAVWALACNVRFTPRPQVMMGTARAVALCLPGVGGVNQEGLEEALGRWHRFGEQHSDKAQPWNLL